MASPLEEEVEIDLRGGIYANESLYGINAHLASSGNAVWGWRYPQAESSFAGLADPRPPFFLRVPTYFPSGDVITPTGGIHMMLDIGFTGSAAAGRPRILIGTDSSDNMATWLSTGGPIPRAAGVAASSITFVSFPFPGCSAYWSTPGAGVNINSPVLFFSHREATQIYYLEDSGTEVHSMNNDGIANTPAGASAMCIHLERLWMARAATGFRSILTYTDPFDAETIRGTNFVTIPDQVNAMTPSTPGEIDQSGVPHLFVGCANSIWMIDGDPVTTSALRRQIVESIGVESPLGVCVTPYGPVFIGTDVQVYLCPPDGRNIIPIGDAVRNFLEPGTSSAVSAATVAWFSPYLYLWPAGNTGTAYICDLTNPQRPSWWGPINKAGATKAIVKAAPGGYSNHAASVSNIATPSIWAASEFAGTSAILEGFDRFTLARGTYPQGHEAARQQSIVSGYIHKEGHQVQLVRATLDTTVKTVAYTWTVRVTNDRGTSTTGVLSSSTPITPGSFLTVPTQRQLYTFPDNAKAVGNALRFSVNGPATNLGTDTSQGMDLQRVRCRVRYIPVNV